MRYFSINGDGWDGIMRTKIRMRGCMPRHLLAGPSIIPGSAELDPERQEGGASTAPHAGHFFGFFSSFGKNSSISRRMTSPISMLLSTHQCLSLLWSSSGIFIVNRFMQQGYMHIHTYVQHLFFRLAATSSFFRIRLQPHGLPSNNLQDFRNFRS